MTSVRTEGTEVLQKAIEVMDEKEEKESMRLYLAESGDEVFRTNPDIPDEEPKQIDPGEEFPTAAPVMWTATRDEIASELDDRDESIPSA